MATSVPSHFQVLSALELFTFLSLAFKWLDLPKTNLYKPKVFETFESKVQKPITTGKIEPHELTNPVHAHYKIGSRYGSDPDMLHQCHKMYNRYTMYGKRAYVKYSQNSQNSRLILTTTATLDVTSTVL